MAQVLQTSKICANTICSTVIAIRKYTPSHAAPGKKLDSINCMVHILKSHVSVAYKYYCYRASQVIDNYDFSTSRKSTRLHVLLIKFIEAATLSRQNYIMRFFSLRRIPRQQNQRGNQNSINQSTYTFSCRDITKANHGKNFQKSWIASAQIKHTTNFSSQR